MNKYNLLDCTLRDGSYITEGEFPDQAIRDIIKTLIDSNLDFVEVGYLNSTKLYRGNSTHFDSISRIAEYLPVERKNAMLLAMVDVDQFKIEDFTPYDGTSVDGIRIVFYKHQIKEAIKYAKIVNELGYKLFMQPMVTIDYSMSEYSSLCDELIKLNPFGISIVDSFGYMTPGDFRKYFKILDNLAPESVIIGFHSHQNMNLALPVAVDVFEYSTARRLVIDCSLLGMGRGAGNLQTELVANYYNNSFVPKYDIIELIRLINEYIVPIKERREWGYTPYYFLTAYKGCHPNYAAFVLENHQISLTDFADYLNTIPPEMKTKCRRPYVEEMYQNFVKAKEERHEVWTMVL